MDVKPENGNAIHLIERIGSVFFIKLNQCNSFNTSSSLFETVGSCL